MDYLGVVILESLEDQDLVKEVTILVESDVKAPPDDPYPFWSRRLVQVKSNQMIDFANKIAQVMKEDFYNHFVNETELIVCFKDRVFRLDKYDQSTWRDMVAFGKTVRVGERWTLSIPVEKEKLL